MNFGFAADLEILKAALGTIFLQNQESQEVISQAKRKADTKEEVISRLQ